jgi:branched-chain amino acid transport system substrate-binding protein
MTVNTIQLRVGALAAVAALALAGAACGDDSGGSADDGGGGPLKIGLITDVTQFADFGLRTKDAVQLAVDEVNDAGGIDGRQVELVFGDSASEPQQAALLTRRMAEDDEVLAILGPFNSGEVEVVFPLADSLKVPVIASTSAAPGLSEGHPWAFRNVATEDQVLAPAVEALKSCEGAQRVAIAYDSAQSVTKGDGEVVLPQIAEQVGLEIVNEADGVTWETGAQNLSAQVTRLKSLDPDAVLLGATAEDAGRLAQEMQRQGFDVPAVGGVPMFNSSLVEIGGDAVEGWYTAGVFYPSNPDDKTRDFVAAIRPYHEKSFPKDPLPIADSATWYDSAKITLDLLAKLPEDASLEETRESIRSGWEDLARYDGVSGVTSMGEAHDAEKEIQVVKVRDREFAGVDGC